MKRLILMRHAKSDWSGGAITDHDRPLNARGRAAAKKLGEWLHTQNILPDHVLTSSAARTQETLALLSLDPKTPTDVARDLYLATQTQILKAVQQAQGDTVLVIGHNPGIGFCAGEIVTSRPDGADFDRYPTGATLVADFDIDTWQNAEWGTAAPHLFVVPKDL